ncbi:ubiquitin-like domain-containing protein CIP73 isoform X2 [Alnus glutinosa]|uniref:ubiquitin-like domain-containing protein CIP73 isoform X2 n=1 Tax=Alnus glutinosa TaxID=3517 RepID=UPI002D7A0147|nr:ubiquitin-like domain-containing protein CIP73 isoform X2 [Alnus glutinosa]
MGSNGVDSLPRADEAGGSEATIEIKIKTLDSQTYTLRVDKQVPVPALKEQIASVTGVLSEQQRLICRGKVLKDDQLLSAYHVEDGHTLHLVVRQPIMPSSEGLSNHPGTDPALSTSRGQSNQVAPGLVIEAFSAVQGDSVPPEINRIVSAVMGSFGITNVVSGGDGTDVREHGAQNPTQLQSEQTGVRGPLDRFHNTYGLPSAVSLGPLQPPVIQDSLTTLSQYLSLMRREFDAIGRGGGNSAQAAATLPTATVQEGFPTPASLAEVMLSTRQMLIEHAGECILQLARQLEDQVNVTDPSMRLSTQSSVRRAGFLIHNLGALLLELGRTTMTLRLGQSPSEAVVNAGPAVFISPSGPNPIMVQPFPFQPGTSLGAIPMGGVQPGPSLVNGLGTGFVPRRIDIQIRRGSSATTPNVNREEHSDTQQPFGHRNSTTNSGGENPIITSASRVSEGPSFGGESGVQVVPTRTMIAAVPGPFSRLPSDSAGNLIGLYYPVLGRFQHVASGLVSGEQGSQASGERHSAGLQTEQQTDSAVQQHNLDGPARDGSFPTPYLRQQEPSNARSGNINIVSADRTQNSQESDGHLPSSVMQFLRTLFPDGEIHVEEASSEGTGRGAVSDHVGASGGFVNAPEAEPRASDEGIFLSNLLHQIIPLISPQAGAEPDARHTEAANASENTMPRDSSTQAEDSDVGTSRRPNDSETSPPNSKRLKTE